MIKTRSKFYYGQIVTPLAQTIDFAEGGVEKQAVLAIKDYTLATIISEVTRAMNIAGDYTYLASVNRTTRAVTITADQPFDILGETGLSKGVTALRMLGFSETDLTDATTYTGDLPCGSEYEPPFFLQDFLGKEDNEESIDSDEIESASGEIQSVNFGRRSSIKLNIRWAFAENYDDGWIKNITASIANLREFMKYITQKRRIEFIPDLTEPNTYDTLRLTSTPDSEKGVGFELKEQYAQGLPGIYETGILKFRVL